MPLSGGYHRPLQNMNFTDLKMWLEKNWPWRAQTGAKMLTADEITAGTITAAEIAAGTITATLIAASTITADKLSITTLSAVSANLGTITAGSLDAVTITGSTITGGTIQTAATGQRVILASNTLKGYAASGSQVFGVEDDDIWAVNFRATGTISVATSPDEVYIGTTAVLIKEGGATKCSISATGLSTSGSVDVTGTGRYKVGATQVVGPQGLAVADATDAASVILRLNDLLARCRAHGLIAT